MIVKESESNSRLLQNLEEVRARINIAAEQSGRRSDDIKLVAVTKYVDVEITRQLIDAGQLQIGESRPQVLWQKAEALSDTSVDWHLIGHLQRNKVKRTVPCCRLIHSVDSARLLQSIEVAAAETEGLVDCLLEVNISGESAKHGLSPDALPQLLESAQELTHVRVCGLMGMSSLSGGEHARRRQYDLLRELRDRYRKVDSERIRMRELSMGMSGDFEVAIAAGATIVRIGSILFEGI